MLEKGTSKTCEPPAVKTLGNKCALLDSDRTWWRISMVVYSACGTATATKSIQFDKWQMHLHKENSSGNWRSIIRLLSLLLQQPLGPGMIVCGSALTRFSSLQMKHAKEDACEMDLEVFFFFVFFSKHEVHNVAQVPRRVK